MKQGRKLFKLKGDIGTSSNHCGLDVGKFGLEAEEMFHMAFLSRSVEKKQNDF